MEKTITVKGIGHAVVKPDLTVVKFGLESTSPDYKQCMKIAGKRNKLVRAAVGKSGFSEDSLKTSEFDIKMKYRSVRDRDGGYGGYREVFDHWQCIHNLKLEFPLDIERLTSILNNVAESGADCKIDIDFTIADPSHVEKALLESAAKNARTKAETLCSAIGAKLGELVNISYNWGKIEIHSETQMDYCCMSDAPCESPKIEPEDIKVRDDATFVWRIE